MLTSHPGWGNVGGEEGKSVFIPGTVGQKNQADEAECRELFGTGMASSPGPEYLSVYITWSYIFAY